VICVFQSGLFSVNLNLNKNIYVKKCLFLFSHHRCNLSSYMQPLHYEKRLHYCDRLKMFEDNAYFSPIILLSPYFSLIMHLYASSSFKQDIDNTIFDFYIVNGFIYIGVNYVDTDIQYNNEYIIPISKN